MSANQVGAPEMGVTNGWLVLHDGDQGIAVPMSALIDNDGTQYFQQTGDAQLVTITDPEEARP
jgi:hypothetical protein